MNIDDKRIINFLKEKNLLDVWTKSIYKEQKEEKPDISFCGLVSVILPCRYFALTTNLIGKIIAPNRC